MVISTWFAAHFKTKSSFRNAIEQIGSNVLTNSTHKYKCDTAAFITS